MSFVLMARITEVEKVLANTLDRLEELELRHRIEQEKWLSSGSGSGCQTTGYQPVFTGTNHETSPPNKR